MYNKFKNLVAGVFGAMILTACATVPISAPVIYQSAKTHEAVAEKALSVIETRAILDEMSPYADLSEAVYRREFKSAADRIAQGCDYVASGKPAELALGLPAGWRKLDQKMIERLGLQSDNVAAGPLKPCRSLSGLNYETYVRLDRLDQVVEAAVAFRGTENTKYQWKEDWLANLRNVDFGVGVNRQFTEARVEVGRLIDALARYLPPASPNKECQKTTAVIASAQAPIYLVGHSLGAPSTASRIRAGRLPSDEDDHLRFESGNGLVLSGESQTGANG